MLPGHLQRAEVHPVRCPEAAAAVQEMLLTLHRSGWHCPTPLPSSPVPVQPQEVFQSWQLPGCGREGLMDYAGCSSLRDRSLSSPEPGWRRSYVGAILPHHARGENKEAPILQRLHPHLRHFICPQASWETSPALDKYEQPLPPPCHLLEQGDNEILKPLWRKSILWQKQLPQ